MSATADRPSPAAVARLVGQAAAEIRRRLLDALPLAPVALPPELAAASGRWKDAPAAVAAEAWTGGPLRLVRVATVRGGPPDAPLAVANVLCLPRDEHPLPILGVDLVALGAPNAPLLAVADLSPTLPSGGEGAAERERALAALRDAVHPAAALAPLPAPAWAAEWLSPHALHVRVAGEEAAAAIAAARAVVDAFLALARASSPRPGLAPVVADARHRYLAAHRADESATRVLQRLRGEEWARRFVREALFPDGPG